MHKFCYKKCGTGSKAHFIVFYENSYVFFISSGIKVLDENALTNGFLFCQIKFFWELKVWKKIPIKNTQF